MEGTYAIIAGEDCVSDYILSKSTTAGDQSDNKIDASVSPIEVVSDESGGFYRTIRIQRPRDHPDTFFFHSNIGDYPIISAKAAYQTHRVAYHGNNRQRMLSFHFPPSPRNSAYSADRISFKPTAKPITSWPTAKPTSASCCIAAPNQGASGYQHAGRNQENPLKCTDVEAQGDCERLMNSRGEFRCEWASGDEFCAYQQQQAQLRDEEAAKRYAEEQREEKQRQKQEREEYEAGIERLAARQKEESRRTEEAKELDRQKHMEQLEERKRVEAEAFAAEVRTSEAAEAAMKMLREQQAAKRLAADQGCVWRCKL